MASLVWWVWIDGGEEIEGEVGSGDRWIGGGGAVMMAEQWCYS